MVIEPSSAEITDGLVDLLVELVHGVGTRAENRAERELISDLRRVRGKEGILFRLAAAALEPRRDRPRRRIPRRRGGHATRPGLREAKANDQAFRQRVRTVLRSSYSSHYCKLARRCVTTTSNGC